MRPVHTARSNFVWVGPTPDVGDLHAFVEPAANRTTTVWEPTPGVRPPVALNVTSEQGDGEDAPEIRERLGEWAKAQA